MAKKDRGDAVNLDSFLDIMTCLVGVLVLIIILTGVDASQIKMVIPTPIGRPTDMRPIFIECRGERLFSIPVAEINEKCENRLREIAREVQGESGLLLERLATETVTTDAYSVDLTYTLVAQFALSPIPGVEGYALTNWRKEGADDWFGAILAKVDKKEERVTFLVRDDSFKVFKDARKLAWSQNIECSYELLDKNDPIKFGLGGAATVAQ